MHFYVDLFIYNSKFELYINKFEYFTFIISFKTSKFINIKTLINTLNHWQCTLNTLFSHLCKLITIKCIYDWTHSVKLHFTLQKQPEMTSKTKLYVRLFNRWNYSFRSHNVFSAFKIIESIYETSLFLISFRGPRGPPFFGLKLRNIIWC